MTEEDRRENSARLKNVEEAVIEFRVIARTVVVEHTKRLDSHDKTIKEIQDTLYLSCDTKSHEIDMKVEKSEELMLKAMGESEVRLTNMANKHFSYAVWAFSGIVGAIGIVCTLGIMWISYSNDQVNNLSDKLGARENVSVRNRENILSTQTDVEHLRVEVKEVKNDVHEILNRIIH